MSRYAQRDGAISASKATGASSDGLTASSDGRKPVIRVLRITSKYCARYMSRLQVVALHESEHEVPCQPRVLPPHVLLLRGPHLRSRSRQMPHSQMPKDAAQGGIPETDF